MPELQRPLWQVRDRVLDLSKRPLVMGILNVTPDSFSDGGEYFDRRDAVARAEAMAAEGADLIDVGGESTRPGATPVDEAEERRRVLPVIEALAEKLDIPLSIDTSRNGVARAAIAAGAHIVNDVSGLRRDPGVATVAAESGAGLVLMHMRGEPRTMQDDPRYDDLLGEIRGALAQARDRAVGVGVPEAAIVLDPGIGFGKTFGHNWEVLARLDELLDLGRPLLVGTSRKGFLRARVGEARRDLEVATVTTSVAACLKGARIVRVHDVRAHRVAVEALASLWAAAAT